MNFQKPTELAKYNLVSCLCHSSRNDGVLPFIQSREVNTVYFNAQQGIIDKIFSNGNPSYICFTNDDLKYFRTVSKDPKASPVIVFSEYEKYFDHIELYNFAEHLIVEFDHISKERYQKHKFQMMLSMINATKPKYLTIVCHKKPSELVCRLLAKLAN